MARIYRKIGLLDHMGGGNLGDDATQDAVMHNIKKRWPYVKMVMFSMNPDDTRKRHGIPSYAIRAKTWGFGATRDENEIQITSLKNEKNKGAQKSWVIALKSRYSILFSLVRIISNVVIRKPFAFIQELIFLLKSHNIIKSFDLLIICGGGQLLDCLGGPWKFPYTIFKWVILAKISKVKCFFLNVGAGPLDHRLSKIFIRKALSFADYVSFRDDKSEKLIREIGFCGGSQVFPDSVYSLEAAVQNKNNNDRNGNPIVGIAPMPFRDPRVYWEKDKTFYDIFIRKLAQFSSWLIENDYFLALFGSDISHDPLAVNDLNMSLKNEYNWSSKSCITKESVNTTSELLLRMASMDYVVTCRLHGVIFAHLMNKPILAISHHPKVNILMSDIGLSEYCVDINNFYSDTLVKKFKHLVENKVDIKKRMAEKLVCYRKELTDQFDVLFQKEVSE